MKKRGIAGKIYFFGKQFEDGKLFVVLKLREQAEVAELVDARDLKSRVQQWTYGFDSRLRHPHLSLISFRCCCDKKPNQNNHEFGIHKDPAE